ncbi:MAG: hypothetical protein ACRDIC_25295 [bacterium]
MNRLDVVITIGNAVGEPAGALGRPVCRLVPRSGDWTTVGTDTRPWYPAMQVFAGVSAAEWSGVIHRAAEALAAQP